MLKKITTLLPAVMGLSCFVTTTSSIAAATHPAPELRVGFSESKCPISTSERHSVFGAAAIAIAGEVAGKVVSNSVTALGDYLSSENAISYLDSTRANGFVEIGKKGISFNRNVACLIVVVGTEFNRKADGETVAKMPAFVGDSELQQFNWQINQATGLYSKALLYLEAEIIFNNSTAQPNPTVFTFAPQYWFYPKFISPDSFKYQDQRDVLLRVELSEPGQKSPFGELELKWTGVAEGAIKNVSVTSKRLPWQPMPGGITDAVKGVTGLSSLGENDAIEILPINVKAIFTETAKPHTILKYIGEALKGQSATLGTAAQDAVTQSLSQQARVTAKQAALAGVEKRYAEYSAAYDAASDAYGTYKSATTPAARAKAAGAYQLAYKKVANLESLTRQVYAEADAGAFVPLPALEAPKS